MGDLRPRLRHAPVRRVAAHHRRQHPRRRPVHQLRRTAPRRRGRLGRGLGARSRSPPPRAWCSGPTCWPPPPSTAPSPPPSSAPSPTWSATTPARPRWPSTGRPTRSSTPGYSHAQLAPTPGRRWRWCTPSPTTSPRGRRAVRHHRHRPAVEQVPRRPRPPGRPRPGSPLKGRALTLADKKRDALQRLYRHDAAGRALGRHRARGDPGGQHLRAPREHRPGEPPGRSGTCSARSPATSASSTAPP